MKAKRIVLIFHTTFLFTRKEIEINVMFRNATTDDRRSDAHAAPRNAVHATRRTDDAPPKQPANAADAATAAADATTAAADATTTTATADTAATEVL